ncbi:AMP-binding enzyme [Nocardia sp. NBC_01009]|uniref:AMP-binding enzyme n=1 Tax=Nocardia sp. NBC_01009 TaxID=2975996 RepID=UPI00386D70E1|nr:AMP-binding protein [Nocardia sp. NBC_01009]
MSCNFADLFEHAVDAISDRVALIEGDRVLTFRELDEQADRLADHLASVDVAPGTHIGFQMHNGIDSYYKDEEKTGRLFKTVDGTRMVVTDDRARAERDGSVTLIGRGNMVVDTGGEKVFVEEVDSVVKAHESIYDAVVIGVPHERWGQQVAAVVSVAAAETVDFAALESHVRRHLAGYKVPRQIWIAPAISRAPSGKPDYRWAKEYSAGRAGSPDGPLMWSICANSLVTTTRTCSNSDVSAVVLGRIR